MIDTVITVLNYLFALSLPVTHVGGYVAAGLGLFFAWKHWHGTRSEPFFMLLKIFIVFGLVRNVFAADSRTGFGTMTGYFTHWFLPFLLGYIIAGEKEYRRAAGTLYFTFMALIVVSLTAYAGFFPTHFGDGFYLVEDNLLKGLRSHIALAALCLLFSFVSLGQYLFRPELSARKKIFFSGAQAFFLFALILTGSRGYYIAAALAYGAFFVFWFVRTRRWISLGVSAAAALCLIAALYASVPAFRERIHRTGLNDQNVSERFALYRVALWEMKAHPLFGFGPGQGIKQTQFFDNLPQEQRWVQRHPALHNFYLNFGADFGLVGLALFIVMAFYWLKALWQRFRSSEGFTKALAFGVFFGLIGVLVGDSFDTLLRGPGVAMELFWLTGLILGQDKDIV